MRPDLILNCLYVYTKQYPYSNSFKSSNNQNCIKMLYSSLRLKPLVLSRFRLIRDDLTAWIQHNVVSAGCWFSSLTVHLNSTVFSAQQQLVKTAPSNIILPVLVLKGGKGELGRKVYFCPLSHVTRAIDKIEEHWEEGLYDIGFQYRLLEETQFSWVHKI